MIPAGDAGTPLLEVRGLTKRFGPVAALSGLDLQVRAGEVHALIGQNGSGKSTLIKSLAGYHQPDDGTIAARGAELTLPMSQGALAEAGLAFLHQDAPAAPAMTVLENIRVGRYGQRLLGRSPVETAVDLGPTAGAAALGVGDRRPTESDRDAARSVLTVHLLQRERHDLALVDPAAFLDDEHVTARLGEQRGGGSAACPRTDHEHLAGVERSCFQ